MKIEYHIDDFISYCVEKGLSRKTYGSYEQTLILLARYLREEQGIDKVEEVKRDHIRDYIKYLRERGKYTVTGSDRTKMFNFPEKRTDCCYCRRTLYGNLHRPQGMEQIGKTSCTGDTIVFDSVSRMSRNAQEGFEIYEELYSRGVDLVFLKEPHINTETYKTALENNIKLTGTNVDFILEGINKYLFSLAKEIIQKHSKDFSGTLSDAEVMKLAGISRNSYYKYKRELRCGM